MILRRLVAAIVLSLFAYSVATAAPAAGRFIGKSPVQEKEKYETEVREEWAVGFAEADSKSIMVDGRVFGGYGAGRYEDKDVSGGTMYGEIKPESVVRVTNWRLGKRNLDALNGKLVFLKGQLKIVRLKGAGAEGIKEQYWQRVDITILKPYN